jgi:hypothetical protein
VVILFRLERPDKPAYRAWWNFLASLTENQPIAG